MVILLPKFMFIFFMQFASLDMAALEKKVCGSCDQGVYRCEHLTFVPSCDWRDAQEELEGQINDKQQVCVTPSCKQLSLSTSQSHNIILLCM